MSLQLGLQGAMLNLAETSLSAEACLIKYSLVLLITLTFKFLAV